jgi:hypothetical protein
MAVVFSLSPSEDFSPSLGELVIVAKEDARSTLVELMASGVKEKANVSVKATYIPTLPPNNSNIRRILVDIVSLNSPIGSCAYLLADICG